MKKFYTLLAIALIIPGLAFAAPKQRITIPFLKKQVTYLANENKALKAEIEALKALQTKTSTELNYCKANPQVVERTIQNNTPIVVSSSYSDSSSNQPSSQIRTARFNVSPVTDDVEVNGFETVTAISLQIAPVKESDSVSINGANILYAGYENGSFMFTLSPESKDISLTINNKTVNSSIVVMDTPDMGSNSNKKVTLQGQTSIDF